MSGYFYVIGDIAYTGSCVNPSDLRLKENIEPIENAVEKVSFIHGIYFNYKDESPEKRKVGVIAQEVEKVLPELVSEDSKGYKSVDYSKLTSLLIEAVKELKTQDDELRTQNEELKRENEELQMQLKRQNEDLLARIEAVENHCRNLGGGQPLTFDIFNNDLIIENLAFRQQLSTYKAKKIKPTIKRSFWIALKKSWSKWTDTLIIVKSETVIGWQRRCFRKHWTKISSKNKK
ncbi:MAG: tail fiber domain-containing protein [Candidatus Hodarchaeota archaeon]